MSSSFEGKHSLKKSYIVPKIWTLFLVWFSIIFIGICPKIAAFLKKDITEPNIQCSLSFSSHLRISISSTSLSQQTLDCNFYTELAKMTPVSSAGNSADHECRSCSGALNCPPAWCCNDVKRSHRFPEIYQTRLKLALIRVNFVGWSVILGKYLSSC